MSKAQRVVGISPTSRGFGFAVLESPENLVDWGLAHVRPPEPQKVAVRGAELLERHQPDLLVLPAGTRGQPLWESVAGNAEATRRRGTR